jgi:sphinganine-1-phosphate aldolase
VVGWTAGLLHGDDAVAGFLTSGGTESILCGVLAARERGRAERGITEPEMVVAESAHAAFHKAAHNFGLTLHKAPVKRRLDRRRRRDGGAVQRQHGARRRLRAAVPAGRAGRHPGDRCARRVVGANCHVDACMGGFVLPFAEMLGREVKPWDFRVDGVTTISADIHKLGYAPKGVSVILHRTKESRAYQTFVFDGWLGGFYASPNMQGTRSGLPMACAWAVMSHLGIEGYLDLTKQTLANADAFRAGVAAIDGIRVLGDGQFHLVAMAADPAFEPEIDMFALGDALLAKGWYHDRQGPPDNLHSTISNTNTGVIEEYLADLAECVASVVGTRTDDRSTTYATLE